jgi:multidrug resistance efflux pump
MLVQLTSLLIALFATVHAQDDGKGQAVICQVEKGGMILSLLPDRSVVKQGDVVCELDSADLKDRLIEQMIAVKRAETEYQAARLARELAELASRQFTQSSYLLEKGAIQSEIKLAEGNLTRTADLLENVTRNFDKGVVSKAQKVAEELSVQKAKYDLEQAQSKLNNLENFAKPMAVKRLSGDVEKARAQEQAAKEIWELRRVQVKGTHRQIESCKIKAPCDGRMVLTLRPPHPGEGAEPVPSRPGDVVRERQELARVIPATP